MYFISGYPYTVVCCDADSQYWLHSLQHWAVLLLINRDMAVAEVPCYSAAATHATGSWSSLAYSDMYISDMLSKSDMYWHNVRSCTDTLYVATSLLTIQQPILQFNTAITSVLLLLLLLLLQGPSACAPDASQP
jgi:hypothetical protein